MRLPVPLAAVGLLSLLALVPAGCGGNEPVDGPSGGDATFGGDGTAGTAGDDAGILFGSDCAKPGDCGGRFLCDTTLGQCVACLDTTDCAAGRVCTGGRCEEKFGCAADTDCDAGKVCDTATANCVYCLSFAQCQKGEACFGGQCIPEDLVPVDETTGGGGGNVAGNGDDDDSGYVPGGEGDMVGTPDFLPSNGGNGTGRKCDKWDGSKTSQSCGDDTSCAPPMACRPLKTVSSVRSCIDPCYRDPVNRSIAVACCAQGLFCGQRWSGASRTEDWGCCEPGRAYPDGSGCYRDPKLQYGCVTDRDCPAAFGFRSCNILSGQSRGLCVECTNDSTCPTAKPVCLTNRCVECRNDGDCKTAEKPVCDKTTFACRAP